MPGGIAQESAGGGARFVPAAAAVPARATPSAAADARAGYELADVLLVAGSDTLTAWGSVLERGIDYSLDMYDLLHPNHRGYQKMAALWLSHLESVLPPPSPSCPSCPQDVTHYWPMDETGGQPYGEFIRASNASCVSCPTAAERVRLATLRLPLQKEVLMKDLEKAQVQV
mgnify:CR=1 FL=1